MENNNIDLTNIPQHIAIIMDGNGRWAEEKGKPRSFGHQAGVEAVRRITAECTKLGVKYLTLYTFSTENWNRPQEEVAALMALVLTSLEDEIFMKNNVRFKAIGDIQRLPQNVRQKINMVMQNTKNNTAMTMVVALSYSSRWEITNAIKKIIKDTKNNIDDLDEKINENLLEQYLETYNMPDPELLIRTGGEQRISNFLLWQIAYTELYFCNTYWPDFEEKNLREAIANYQNRNRRFGKTQEQVENKL